MILNKNYLGVQEFCNVTGFKKCAVYKLCKNPTFPYIKIGIKFFIDYEKAMQWFADSEKTNLKGVK